MHSTTVEVEERWVVRKRNLQTPLSSSTAFFRNKKVSMLDDVMLSRSLCVNQ